MALAPNLAPPGSNQYEVPYFDGAAISVSTAFPACRGIYNGGASQDITVTLISGASITFKAVPVGVFLPVAATLVTAAANGNLLALY